MFPLYSSTLKAPKCRIIVALSQGYNHPQSRAKYDILIWCTLGANRSQRSNHYSNYRGQVYCTAMHALTTVWRKALHKSCSMAYIVYQDQILKAWGTCIT